MGRLRAACGVVGPLSFTAAWVFATLRQGDAGGYSLAREHVSGLGAPDAAAPAVVNGGFVALGACTIAFAGALEAEIAPSCPGRDAGPLPEGRLLRAGGAACAVAGVLRRDRMLLAPPPGAPLAPSWRNRGHDIASAVGYGTLVVVPLLVGLRLRAARRAQGARRAFVTCGLAAASLGLFASGATRPLDGVVQRVTLTVPLWWMAAFAAPLVRRGDARARPPGRQKT